MTLDGMSFPWPGRSSRTRRPARRRADADRDGRADVAVDRERYAELAVAGERVRIAREVHDIVAHSLSVMIALADGAAFTLDRDPDRARDAMTQAAETGRAALAEIRQSLTVLRTASDGGALEVTPDPGLADLDALLDSVRGTGLQVSYRTSGSTHDLSSPVQLAIYRVVQEATTNTVKHARRATRLTVSIRLGQADVRVMIDDNGDPTPAGPDQVGAPPGHGLLGMRERVALHDGRLFAGPTTAGWRVSAWLPLGDERPRR